MTEPRETFTYNYWPTLADAKAGVAMGTVGSPGRLARTLTLLVVFPALVMSLVLRSVASGVFFGIAWGCFFALVFREWLARYILKRQLSVGVAQITVDATGVTHQASGRTSHLGWSAVSSVRELDRAYILFGGGKVVGSIEKAQLGTQELHELHEFIASFKPIAKTGFWRSVA